MRSLFVLYNGPFGYRSDDIYPFFMFFHQNFTELGHFVPADRTAAVFLPSPLLVREPTSVGDDRFQVVKKIAFPIPDVRRGIAIFYHPVTTITISFPCRFRAFHQSGKAIISGVPHKNNSFSISRFFDLVQFPIEFHEIARGQFCPRHF